MLLVAAALLGGAPAASAATTAAAPAAPRIIAPAAILVEPATQDIVYARNADQRRLIASTTKLMTAHLALEKLDLSDVLSAVDYHAMPAESVIGLRAGEKLTAADLLRGLLIASGNDAAATLATRVGGSIPNFVRMMNAEAKRLGLTHTHYANPIGLDAPDNKSSPSDLVKLALILRENAFFREVTKHATVTLRSGDHPRTLVNRDTLVGAVPYVNGVKTGHTNAAGYCLVGSATLHGVTVVSAVLGDPSEAARNADTLALLRYGLSRYHVVHPVKARQAFAHVKLRFRDSSAVLVAQSAVTRTARVGEHITTHVTGVPSDLAGPLPEGARVGTILVRQRGKVVARVPLVTAAAVPAASIADRLSDFAGRMRTIVALAAFVVCSLLLLLIRRRVTRRRRRVEGAPVA